MRRAHARAQKAAQNSPPPKASRPVAPHDAHVRARAADTRERRTQRRDDLREEKRLGQVLKFGFGADLAVGATLIGDAAFGGPSREDAIDSARRVRDYERMIKDQWDEAERLVQENQRLLIQNMPHLAEEVMSGRRLPRGAVVFGRKRKVDELQVLAEAMAKGAFKGSPQEMDPVQEALAGVQGI